MFEDEIVCLVNRTLDPVPFMYDGHEYILTPLEEKHVRKPLAEHALRKTRYGLNANTGQYHYRLGIKGLTPCEPIEDAEHPDRWVNLDTKKSDLSDKVVMKKFANPDMNPGALVDF